MAITINIYYTGKDGDALKFAQEMVESGIVEEIKKEKGNLAYDYFTPLNDKNTILLIDRWENQEAIDAHHQSWMMNKIIELRNKYDLHMVVQRFTDDQPLPLHDQEFIRK